MACNQWLHLKAAAAAAKPEYREETLREHCRKGWVHAHRIGKNGPWIVEVTAAGFVAEAPASCDCMVPRLGSAVPRDDERDTDEEDEET